MYDKILTFLYSQIWTQIKLLPIHKNFCIYSQTYAEMYH